MTNLEINNKDLLEFYISNFYLPNIFSTQQKQNWVKGEKMELIIRPECNQNCQYCYITNYEDKIYPIEGKVNKQEILKNINLILSYLITNKIYVPLFDLFAEDLFEDNIIYDILQIFYDNYSKIPQELFKTIEDITICIPTNGYFLQFKEHQNKIIDWVKKLKEIHIHLFLFWSTNINSINEKVNQDFFDKVFPFMAKMGYMIYPMVSPEEIDNAISNYEWFTKMNKKYEMPTIFPYPLEVRNGNWTEDRINKFINFINYIWDKRFGIFNNSVKDMAEFLFNTNHQIYDLIVLSWKELYDKDNMSCNVQTAFTINVSDLSLPLCHRLIYPQFTGGKFKIKDNQISGIEATQGLSGYLSIKTLSPQFFVKCCECNYRDVCIKGCLGAQYEWSGELLCPIPSVCALEKAKINTLLKLYIKSGVLEYAITNDLIKNESFKNWILFVSKKEGLLNEQ